MIGGESLSLELAELIKSGKIDESRIDESIRRIMDQKFRLGLFDSPYLNSEALNSLNNPESISKELKLKKNL
jgi:beta-glucosidase